MTTFEMDMDSPSEEIIFKNATSPVHHPMGVIPHPQSKSLFGPGYLHDLTNRD